MNARAAVATSLGLLLVAASALAQGQRAPRLDDMALCAIINKDCMTTKGTTDPVSKVENIVIPAEGRQIPARIYRPGGNGPHPVLVFFHGGAMLAGNLETHDNACRYLCHRAPCTVVSVDYRLAPEHKFPAQVNDCYAATVWVAANAKDLGVDAARLALIGDSAGGMFTAAVCLMARDRKGPAIRFQVLVNPALNLARQRPMSDEVDRVVDRIIKESYLKDPKDAVDPLASPLLAETFKGLPPALVVTAERDVWREDGEEYVRRLSKDGVKVNIYRQEGIGHLGPLWARAAPTAELSLDIPIAALKAAFRPDETDAGASLTSDVDAYVAAEMEKQHLPGLSLAVTKSGKVIKAKGYGLASLETNTPATPETVYELGSLTKQFTATAIILLASEKKLSLDDPIDRWVPGVPDTWRQVRIRHLLNHTSGIPNHTEMAVIRENEGKAYELAELLAVMSEPPVKFRPGEAWAYNDSGYVLLGWVVEKASGRPYASFLTDRIFRPLGMSATRANAPEEVVPNRASGYVRRDGLFHRGRPVSPTQSFGAGHLMSTALDLAKWDATLQGSALLTRPQLEQMWTPTRLNDGRKVSTPWPIEDLKDSSYGFGWLVGCQRGHRIVAHGGSISSGFSTYLVRFLDDRLTVIVLTNRAVASSADDPFAPGHRARTKSLEVWQASTCRT